jgi:hypothetical protein
MQGGLISPLEVSDPVYIFGKTKVHVSQSRQAGTLKT